MKKARKPKNILKHQNKNKKRRNKTYHKEQKTKENQKKI